MSTYEEMIVFIKERKQFMLSKRYVYTGRYNISSNKFYPYWYKLKYLKPYSATLRQYYRVDNWL